MEAHLIGYTKAGPQAARPNAPAGNGDLFQALLRETAQRLEAEAPLPRRDATEARDARDIEPADRARAAETPDGEAARRRADTADERPGAERNAAPSQQSSEDDPAEAEAGIAETRAKPDRSNRDDRRAEKPTDAARQAAQSDTDNGSPAGTATESIGARPEVDPQGSAEPGLQPSFAARLAANGQSASTPGGLVPATARAATPATSNVTGPGNAPADIKAGGTLTPPVPGAAAQTAGGPQRPAAGPDGAALTGAEDGEPARSATTPAAGRAVAASAGANPQAAGARPNQSADPQVATRQTTAGVTPEAAQPVPPGGAIRAPQAQTGQAAGTDGTSRPAGVPGTRPAATVPVTGAQPTSGGAQPTPDADAAAVTQVRAPASATAQTAQPAQPARLAAATGTLTLDGTEATTSAAATEGRVETGRLVDKGPAQSAPTPATANGRPADAATAAGTPQSPSDAASGSHATGIDQGPTSTPTQIGDSLGRATAGMAAAGAGPSSGPSTIGQGPQMRGGEGTPVAIDDVAVHIQRAAARGEDRIRIRLHPAELGRIDVRLKVGPDGLVKVVVSIERSETFDLMQRDARGLERALQDAGLKTDSGSLSFNLRGDGQDGFGDRHERAEDTAARPAQTAIAAPDAASRTEYVPVLTDRAVDFRV